MKTYELIREGVPTVDGRLVPDGATTWREGPLPVTTPEDGIVGKLENIRREGNSVVGDTDVECEALTAESDNLGNPTYDETTGIMTIHSCRIMGAAAWDFPEAFPWRDDD